MLRLTAEVQKTRRINEISYKRGMTKVEQSCWVKIKGPAKKKMKLPKGLKGKLTKIKCESVLPWKVKKNDTLILSLEQTKETIMNLIYNGKKPVPEPRAAKAITNPTPKYSLDVNLDGFKENILQNSFVQIVIAPHYGARIQQIISRYNNKTQLFGTFRYERDDYIELGGIEETLEGVRSTGKLWNQEYKSRKTEGLKFKYYTKLSKKDGLKVEKSISLSDKLPLIRQAFTFTLPEKKKKDEKKNKDKNKKTKVNFTQRLFIGLGGEINHNNVFWVPTKEKLVSRRFNKPYWVKRWNEDFWSWKDNHFALSAGFTVATNDFSNDTLAILFDPRLVESIWTGISTNTPRLFVNFLEKKLKKTQKIIINTALIYGNLFALNGTTLMMLTLGETTHAGITACLTMVSERRYKQCTVKMESGDGIDLLSLDKLNIEGCCNIFHKVFTIESSTKEFSLKFEKGNEILSLKWSK